MAYLGKTPSQATRARYYYTATGGETSLSGSDDNGNTLVFSDGNYVDVMLNGVTLVAGTDYDTTTANTIGGLTALTASDVVEVVVYDTFSVFGGNVNGNFNIQNGTLTASQGITVDNDGATVATFDRATSDGTIAEFQKDGSAVGSIGVDNGSDLYIGSDDAGILFAGGGNAITPYNPTSQANRDAAVNLGLSSTRFKDLYLSGGVYLGGTGAANYIEDYEEGTWTPVLSTKGTDFTSVTYDTGNTRGTYTKIGDTVFFRGVIKTTAITVGSASGQIIIDGLPFTSQNVAERGAVTLSEQGRYGAWTTTPSTASVQSNSTHFWLFKLATLGGGHTDLVPADVGTQNFTMFTGQYKVA